MSADRLVSSLSYLEFGTRRRAEWTSFATDMLGVPTVDDVGTGALHLRMDARYRYSVSLREAAEERLTVIGWDVRDAASLDRLGERVEAMGYPVAEAGAQECAARDATRILWFRDPDGIRTELVNGRRWVDEPLLPALPMDGIRGLGHLTWATPQLSRYLELYQEALGFRLTDYRSGRLYFLRCNERHHSLALAQSAEPGVHHFFVDLESLDDVGRGYDRVRAAGLEIEAELGRHGNDRAISYYVKCPSGFSTECGWGGLEVDDDRWVAHEFTKGDLWGHRRRPEEAARVAQAPAEPAPSQPGEVLQAGR